MLFLHCLKNVMDSFQQTPDGFEKAKSILSALTIRLNDGKSIPLVDPMAYKLASTLPELMLSMSPYWNCLSSGLLENLAKALDHSASIFRDFSCARDANAQLILAALVTTDESDQSDSHSDLSFGHMTAHSAPIHKLQSRHPAVFARLPEHQRCAPVNVTRISVEVSKAVLHLKDYDRVTEAIATFLKLPISALVYCGCTESPLVLCWEICRGLLTHIKSVQPSRSHYYQLTEQSITGIAVGDEIKYSCPRIKVRGTVIFTNCL